jgi:hypothetical protein
VNDEERIRQYLRSRADVPVPDDLRLPTATSVPRRRWSFRAVGALGRLAVAGLVLVVVAVGIFLRLPSSTGPAGLSSPSASGSGLATGHPLDGTFPAQIDGLPVLTVAQTVDLLRSGKLDGQAVAVAGYYSAFYPSCPYPGRYIGPLERWCDFDALADTRAGAQLCQPLGDNGMSCSQPTGTYLSPFFRSETSGDPNRWLTGGATGEPAALVLIGHAGDPRQWQCTSATQAQCANAFVVDRVAWAAGQEVPLSAPQTGDQLSGAPLTPKMTLAQVAAVVGPANQVVGGAAFRAGDIASVDPRWNLAGDSLVWLVRSIAGAAPSPGDATRPETVWLVDDATGKVLDSQPLKLGVSYQPARVWQMATVHGLDCCGNNVLAFERVESGDGTVVYEGQVSGGASGTADTTTFGGGYGSLPLVLPPGQYSITVWMATYDRGVMGTPTDGCSTQATLRPLDVVTLNADFPTGKACTFVPAPSPGP